MIFNNTKRLGLALSGGGYRAAAFHLGVLRVLDRNNVLQSVDVLSTVSGGSIVGAAYAIEKGKTGFSYKNFEANFIMKLKRSVIAGVLKSVYFIIPATGVVTWIVLIVYLEWRQFHVVSWLIFMAGLFLLFQLQFKLFPFSKIIESVYDRIFFEKRKLPDFPTMPLLAINSTNLDTGRQFTFSRSRMGDSAYEYADQTENSIKFTPTDFPVSRAVMASSCVPFAFTPVPIDKDFFVSQSQANDVTPMLIDGGVYDNQGMHKLTSDESSYSCQVIITSDAGNRLSKANPYKNVFTLLMRTMDLFMNRIKNFQIMDNLYGKNAQSNPSRQIAYLSLGWNVDESITRFINDFNQGLINVNTARAHAITSTMTASQISAILHSNTKYQTVIAGHQSSQKTLLARGVGTNLTALPDAEICALINHAEIMAEIQIRLYCPGLLK